MNKTHLIQLQSKLSKVIEFQGYYEEEEEPQGHLGRNLAVGAGGAAAVGAAGTGAMYLRGRKTFNEWGGPTRGSGLRNQMMDAGDRIRSGYNQTRGEVANALRGGVQGVSNAAQAEVQGLKNIGTGAYQGARTAVTGAANAVAPNAIAGYGVGRAGGQGQLASLAGAAKFSGGVAAQELKNVGGIGKYAYGAARGQGKGFLESLGHAGKMALKRAGRIRLNSREQGIIALSSKLKGVVSL